MPTPALDGLWFTVGLHGGAQYGTMSQSRNETKSQRSQPKHDTVFCSSLLRDQVEGFASGVLEESGYLSGVALVNSVEWGSAELHR